MVLTGLGVLPTAVLDTYSLLMSGRIEDLQDRSLRGVLCLEAALLCCVSSAVLLICERRYRVLQTAAWGVSRDLRINPVSLRLSNDAVAQLYDTTVTKSSRTLYAVGRWVGLFAYALLAYSIYKPVRPDLWSKLGHPCADQPCEASCHIGRKLHIGVWTIFLLLSFYATWARRSSSRRDEHKVNLALRLLLTLPALVGRSLAPCWTGRGFPLVSEVAPAMNVVKTVLWVINLELLLPTAPCESFAVFCFNSISVTTLSRWLVPRELAPWSDAAFELSTSCLPVLLLSSLVFLFLYFRDSHHLQKFLKRQAAWIHFD
eukprot:CAMPEP_0177760454 /NCGR_PEP_ID=MMETSP0491_2-20121128/5276_1 /TAXON_ID=63592 /ORGANISM="Tetraselmis chuii, Strain PLY429" /LENGTH=315 /DNA_ID=CAMNT_0019276355 /DNA_START=247 /DNA_END=1194 /DNA_ORIENTATION=+